MVATAAGGAMQAYGSYAGGVAAQRQADYQAAVSRNNAMVSAAQARDAQERGDIEQAQYARQLEQYKGQQRVALASNGIMGGSGSALRVVEDTAMLGHLDAETLRRNTERDRLGFVNQRNQFLHDAKMQQDQGRAARRAGIYGAITSAAGTAANLGLVGAGGAAARYGAPSAQTRVRINPRAVQYFRPRPQGVF